MSREMYFGGQQGDIFGHHAMLGFVIYVQINKVNSLDLQ